MSSTIHNQEGYAVEQFGTATPRVPIIVLGKQNDYLSFGLTIDDAVEKIRRYLSVDNGCCHDAERSAKNFLRFDELDFFDITGQRLEPILETRQLKVVGVDDHRDEIRDRMRGMFREIVAKISKDPEKRLDVDDAVLGLPDNHISFEELIRRLVHEDHPINSAMRATTSHDTSCEASRTRSGNGVHPPQRDWNWICKFFERC